MLRCRTFCSAATDNVCSKPTEGLPWFFLFLLTVQVGSAAAQDPPARFRESITLETSRQASRQIATAIEHAKAGRWEEGAEELSRVMASEPDSLIAIAPGRYLNVRRYANLIATTFPPEGLAPFRKRLDRQAAERFEAARDSDDEESLRRIVRDSFTSSSGDDALLLLGDIAFERDDFGAARAYWQQILPSPYRTEPGEPAPVFRYPDSQLGSVPVLARLVLCSIVEGDRTRAGLEMAAFAKMHPNESGSLAGRTGVLADIVRELLKESAGWKKAVREDIGAETLLEVGAPLWSRPIADDPYRARDSISFFDQRTLSTFPVVHRNFVLFNDAHRVFAYEFDTGKPAWPSGEKDSGEIYSAIAGGEQPPLPERPMVGLPRYTMTASEGRLYARMGSPVTGRSAQELRKQDDRLVCLDLDRGEGKLVWQIETDASQPSTAFEGSPVVSEGQLYVAMRQGFPETQTNVACREAASGRLLWNRRVGAAVSDISESQNLISHHLLTLGDDAVFYSTDMGAVAALERSDGVVRWVTTYETSEARAARMLDDPAPSGLSTCVYHAGVVFVAPGDSEAIYALDSSTGAPTWQRELPDRVRYVLGLGERCLIVSGRLLWGLDHATGAVRWQVGYSDSTAGSYGQGQIAAGHVFWPTRDEIFVVAQDTGEIRRRIPLSALHGIQGGNLTISDRRLVIAGTDLLTVFGARSSSEDARSPLYSAVKQ